MKLKRYPKAVIKKHFAEQFLLPLQPEPPSEPHQIVRCMVCDAAQGLEFIRDGDDRMYYICSSCGFESEPMGMAPHWLK